MMWPALQRAVAGTPAFAAPRTIASGWEVRNLFCCTGVRSSVSLSRVH